MDKSSSAKCLLYSDVVKGEPSPTGRGRRSRDDQGVGDIRFTNILQLFLFISFFQLLYFIIFFYTFFYPPHLPTPTTHDLYHYPRHLATLVKTSRYSLRPEL